MDEQRWSLTPEDFHRRFQKRMNPLYSESEGTICEVSWENSGKLFEVLLKARRSRHLVGGLEAIEKILQKEEKGLASLRQSQPGQRKPKVTRLLLISADGSERFYKSCEIILKKYGNRVVGIRLQAQGRDLGSSFFGHDTEVKAILLKHKVAVENFLDAFLKSH